uniref:Ras-related protein Rab-7b n=1 Tax=Strongyloides papillosus TaxID=174720 RepID=A0A0N5C345_STREA
MDNLKFFLAKPIIKVLVLGDSGVGKTAIIRRFTENYYLSKTNCTIGVDFNSKDMIVGNVSVTLQIWDTAGQERFQALGDSYFRGADCCILVYDVTNPESFARLQYWKDEFLFHSNRSHIDDFPFIVFGNKIDETSRSVTKEYLQRWHARNNNIPYFEVSAKEDLNIQFAFSHIPKLVMERIIINDDDNNFNINNDTISLKKSKQKSKNKCSC